MEALALTWAPILEASAGTGLRILAWMFVIYGVSFVLFRNPLVSSLADRLRRRLWLASRRTQPIEREIGTGHVEGNEALPKLSDEQLEERLGQLDTARKAEPFARYTLALLDCAFCRAFWVALAFALVFESGWSIVASAVGYAALCSALIDGFLLKAGSSCGCGK